MAIKQYVFTLIFLLFYNRNVRIFRIQRGPPPTPPKEGSCIMGKGLKEKGDLPKFSKEGSVGRKKMGFQKNGMIR